MLRNDPFHPQVRDVFTVRRDLLEFLPVELVNTILDDACYWPVLSCTFYDNYEDDENALRYCATLAATYENDNDATICLLVTRKLDDWFAWSNNAEEPVSYHLREVMFTITSHDQGWCSNDGFDGSYSF